MSVIDILIGSVWADGVSDVRSRFLEGRSWVERNRCVTWSMPFQLAPATIGHAHLQYKFVRYLTEKCKEFPCRVLRHSFWQEVNADIVADVCGVRLAWKMVKSARIDGIDGFLLHLLGYIQERGKQFLFLG